MYDFELTFGEAIGFLEIAPTKELTGRGASFSSRERAAGTSRPTLCGRESSLTQMVVWEKSSSLACSLLGCTERQVSRKPGKVV